jgi:hypothetical protein
VSHLQGTIVVAPEGVKVHREAVFLQLLASAADADLAVSGEGRLTAIAVAIGLECV